MIRRAYAAQLKIVHPEDDAAGFQALRQAYERALAMAAWAPAPSEDDDNANANDADDDVEEETTDDAAVEADETPRIEPRAAPEPPPPSPPAPLSELDLHDAACRTLERLVAERAPAADMATALEVVLTSPSLERIAVHVRTEAWLAGVIAGALPRTDGLIAPAIARFQWRADDADLGRDRRIAAVVARRRDLDALAAMRAQDHPMRQPLALLDALPTRRSVLLAAVIPRRLPKLQHLLDTLERQHPGVAVDFPPGAFAAWRAVLAKPRIDAMALTVTMASAWLLGLMVAVATPRDPYAAVSLWVFLRDWLAFSAAGLAALAFKLYAVDIPRDLWRRRWSATARPEVRLGWAPAALALLVIAAVGPGQPWSIAATVLAATGIIVWAATVGERFTPAPALFSPWRRWVGRNLGLALLWWLFLARQPPGFGVEPALAALAAGLATCFAEADLAGLWVLGLGTWARRGALAAMVIAAAALTLIATSQSNQTPSLPLVMGITLLGLLQRLPAAAAPPIRSQFNVPRVYRLVLGGFVGGGLFLLTAGKEAAPLIAMALPLAAGGGLAFAWAREPKTQRRQRS